EAVLLDRIKTLSARRTRTFALDGEHHRDRRAVDIRVEQTDFVAERAERDGEVRRDRRFADPALSACHRDDPARAGQARASGALAQFSGDLVDLELNLF